MTTHTRAGLRIPPEWQALAADASAGTLMIIGASDTGKSTLARYLFQELSRRGVRAAYLDADVGQNTLGLPATMSVAMAREAGDPSFPPAGPMATFFVGATTPRGHMLPVVTGAFRLRQRALEWGAQAIVVDTTGLVDKAQGGKALKQWKIELLAPDLLIGLQRDRELEPILCPLRREPRLRSIELPVSPAVATRSREVRILYRRERFLEYLAGAPSQVLSLRKVAIYELERLSEGAVLACQDAAGFVLGLGVVEELDRARALCRARTPVPDLAGAVSLRIGTLRWDLLRSCEY